MKFFSFLLALAVAASPLADSHAAPAKKASARKAPAKAKVKAKTRKPVAAAPVRSEAADALPPFSEWPEVNAFADEIALRNGFPRAELAALLADIRYVDSAVQLVKPAPKGKAKNWQTYSRITVEPVRINAGVKFWNEHAETLARAEAQFGVPAEIIVGIIGVETVYGRNTGRYRVLDVLTTLGFAYPEAPNRAARMAFFQGELENALLLARKNNIEPFSLLGSFAGAIGMPQFMPGSVLAYGVDFDQDGAVDLRGSAVDAIGSVASFLVHHGWQRSHAGPIAYSAKVAPGGAWDAFIGQGLSAKFTPEEMKVAGVATTANLPPGRLFGLIDLQNGPDPTEYWVATDNFFAITQYNRSYFYAMSVVELGRAVRLTRGSEVLAAPETL